MLLNPSEISDLIKNRIEKRILAMPLRFAIRVPLFPSLTVSVVYMAFPTSCKVKCLNFREIPTVWH